ncbi:uncharacterized protein LOC134271318 [Saccostrea cucullata]|uniref:uncharacterized protein LOC134271318 n=1 Tax=Saccostrea cuccullata TaxID=36930 RepID=UPI002ED31D1D
MKWTVVGVLITVQFISIVCGVQDSQQTIHDHLQSEHLIPVQSQAAKSHLVYEGSGDINDQSEKTPVYKVTRPPPSSKPPKEAQNFENGASVVILHKPSPAIIVLIVILILLLLTSLLAIGYLWRRVRVLKERQHKKPYPTEGEFDEDEYSVMMDWNTT